jgi:hypothetical protein
MQEWHASIFAVLGVFDTSFSNIIWLVIEIKLLVDWMGPVFSWDQFCTDIHELPCIPK